MLWVWHGFAHSSHSSLQTGLTQQDVQVSTVTFFVDILVTLEGVFALNAAQQSTLIGVRHDNSCPKPLE
jgi:hypothetical protein